jgi:hypothetical protein
VTCLVSLGPGRNLIGFRFLNGYLPLEHVLPPVSAPAGVLAYLAWGTCQEGEGGTVTANPIPTYSG